MIYSMKDDGNRQAGVNEGELIAMRANFQVFTIYTQSYLTLSSFDNLEMYGFVVLKSFQAKSILVEELREENSSLQTKLVFAESQLTAGENARSELISKREGDNWLWLCILPFSTVFKLHH
jgi:hypothetical protein